MSKPRFDILKKHFDKSNDPININNKSIKFNDLDVKDLKNSIKIFFKNDQKDKDINDIENKMLKLVYDKYLIEIKSLYL